MKPIRYLSILLLAAMLLSFAVACQPSPVEPPDGTNDGGEPSDDPAPPDDSEQADEPAFLTLVSDAQIEYKMIRADNAKSEVKSAFSALQKALTVDERKPAMDTDYAPVGEKEILVGKTNRPASATALERLLARKEQAAWPSEGFIITVTEEALIILGTSDEATVSATQYFVEHILEERRGALGVRRDTEIMMSLLQLRLEQEMVGSPLKKQYSDYIDSYTEDQLLDFDTLDFAGAKLYPENGSYEIDEDYQREGKGALRFTMTRTDKALANVLWYGGESFSFSVDDLHRSTLKLWLFLDEDDHFASDHDAGYGRQAAQATFFFRVFDKAGRVYCWNHTLTGDGWHEVELTFNTHNGKDPDFDYQNIVGFGLLTAADAGTIIELDDLRGLTYATDYTPAALPNEGDRRITSGDYDALDGLIVQEWYGCSYDLEDKVTGKSSIRCEGDISVNDFRTIIGEVGVPMSYQNDVLVFFMKIDDLNTVKSLFIELNEEQDVHEYEMSFDIATLQSYGLSTKPGEWSEIAIPLSVFQKNLRPDQYGESEDINLTAARFVISGVQNKTYTVHYDDIYLTTKQARG